MTRHRSRAAVPVLVVWLAGCSDPYAARPTATPSATLPAGELPGSVPDEERRALSTPRGRPAPNTEAALRRYAQLLTNWTSNTVADQYRRASELAIGQARRDAEQTAASAGSDAQLRGTSSDARTAAVVSQAGGWSLVITRERLTPDAGPARYRIYRAHTRPVDGGVAVDRWEPQP
jgi:hypothetical protein